MTCTYPRCKCIMVLPVFTQGEETRCNRGHEPSAGLDRAARESNRIGLGLEETQTAYVRIARDNRFRSDAADIAKLTAIVLGFDGGVTGVLKVWRRLGSEFMMDVADGTSKELREHGGKL